MAYILIKYLFNLVKMYISVTFFEKSLYCIHGTTCVVVQHLC